MINWWANWDLWQKDTKKGKNSLVIAKKNQLRDLKISNFRLKSRDSHIYKK